MSTKATKAKAETNVMHIGKIIRQHLEEKGMTKSEFARRTGTSPQNIYGIFRRKSIDTDLLRKISIVLEFDFFTYYSGTIVPRTTNTPADLRTMQEVVSENESLKKEIQVLSDQNKYLKEIYELNKQKSAS